MKPGMLTDGDATDCTNMTSFKAVVLDHLLAVSALSREDQVILRDTLIDAPGKVSQDNLLAGRILDSVCDPT